MKTRLTIMLGAKLVGLTAFALPLSSGYMAHEWGTFTSVQAADGVQMRWNPLTVSELPDFVYGVAWPDGRKPGQQNAPGGKGSFFALQRMETPVIYFYADEPQSVNVSVNFPEGKVTEWYPRASRANPLLENGSTRLEAARGAITWSGVNILPRSDDTAPRQDQSGSHYYAARQTDANLLRIDTARGSETEHFLFYRGVGSFETPLKVMQEGEHAETIQLRNAGAQDLHALFVYQVQGDRAAWRTLPHLGAGESTSVHLQSDARTVSRAEFRDQVTPALRKALVAEGLFDREAAAMVKTWDESWFAEQGVRVLYILPREWTDQTLPLTLSPAPQKLARVMVGRAELITPAMENALRQEVVHYAGNEPNARAGAVEKVRQLGLGRFSEVVLRRILARAPVTSEFSNRAWELLQVANKAPESKRLAQK